MLEIDGSEGGGQILRTALGLSALTRKAFRISNIRASRPKPGLRPQHLAAVRAVAELCNGTAENAKLGSAEITFYPRDIKARTLSVDIGTAGSTTLLLQALLPALKGNFHLKVTGGTDVSFSPPLDYFTNVLLPHLRKFADFKVKVLRRGFYPVGEGSVDVSIRAKEISAPLFDLNYQGELLMIKGTSIASTSLQKAEIAERQARAAKMLLKYPVSISTEYAKASSPGSSLVLWAVFGKDGESSHVNPVILGGSSLGEKGKNSENVGREAASRLMSEINSGASVDQHLADQLLPFLAIAGGSLTTSGITGHVKSNIYTIEKFLPVKFSIKGNKITARPV